MRQLALFGYWGRHVGITDGRFRYLRGCGETNFPLSMWSNRWSTMPIPAVPQIRLPRPDARATLRHMPGTDVPVIRQPFAPGDPLPFWAAMGLPRARRASSTWTSIPTRSKIWWVGDGKTNFADALAAELRKVQAPNDLFERVGLGLIRSIQN